TSNAGVHRWRRIGTGKKHNAFSVRPNQMFSGKIGCTAVINSHEIVLASSGIGLKTTIKKDYWNTCSVQSRDYAMIGLASMGTELHWSEKYASDFSRNILLA